MVFLNVDGKPFSVYKIGMKAGGLWPSRNTRWSTIVFSMTILIQVAIVLTCLINPLPNCLPFGVRNTHNQRIAISICAIITQISIRVYRRSMVPLIEVVMEDWFMTTDPKEWNIIKQHNRKGQLFFYCLLTIIIGLGFIYHFCNLPIVDKFIFLNKQNTCDNAIFSNFLPLLTLISWSFDIPLRYTFILLFWSLTMHLSGQLKILKYRFKNFLKIEDKTVRRREFRRLVDRHNRLLDLIGHLDKSFNVNNALEVIALQLGVCMTTLKLAANFEMLSFTTVIKDLISFAFSVTVFFMFYYAGDYITFCCEEIGEALTQCNWYDLSKESIIDYSIVVARCQKPKTLTVVKMYELNLYNLKYVLNAQYSYITCIAAVVRAKREQND